MRQIEGRRKFGRPAEHHVGGACRCVGLVIPDDQVRNAVAVDVAGRRGGEAAAGQLEPLGCAQMSKVDLRRPMPRLAEDDVAGAPGDVLGADDDVVDAIMVHIADAGDGTRKIGIGAWSLDLDAVGAVERRQVDVAAQAAGLAEDDVGGSGVFSIRVGFCRADDQVGDAVAVQVSG